MTEPPVPSAVVERARQMVLDGADDDTLYASWYHDARGVVTTWPDPLRYVAGIADARRFEPGWRVVHHLPGRPGWVAVEGHGRERVAHPPLVAPDDPARLDLAPGTPVSIDPIASGPDGGFWHVWSVGWQGAAPARISRLYLNIGREHAVAAMATICRLAPQVETWSAKALTGDHDLGRSDAVVVFLAEMPDLRTHWVGRIAEHVAPWCRDRLPPFVRPLRPGIGVAADPGDGRSFGQAVCGAVTSVRWAADDARAFHDALAAAIGAIPGSDEARTAMGCGPA